MLNTPHATRPEVRGKGQLEEDCRRTLHRAYVGVETGCPRCRRFIKPGGYSTAELVDLFGWESHTAAPVNPTSPEQRAEIFAATDAYNEARALYDQALDRYIAAHRGMRTTVRLGARDGAAVYEGPAAAVVGEERTAATDLTAAEEAMARAQRHLNEVSRPPAQRGRGKQSLLESAGRWILG